MMKKMLTICAAIAAFVCAAAPDDIATEAYAHYEATNECAKVNSVLTSLIAGRHNQAKAYADTKSAAALASAKEYADGRLVAAKEYSDDKVAAVVEDIEASGYLTPSATNGLAKTSYVDAKTDGMATTAWVEGLGYVSTPALLGMGYASTNDVRELLTPYATKTYVVGLGYLTEDEMKAWVNGQVFAKESWVTDKMSVMDGEVRQWVFDQNYADKDWVANYHNTHGGGGGSEPMLTPIYSDTPTFSEWIVEASDGESDITVVPSPPGGEFVVWLGIGDAGEFVFDEPNSRDFYATELHGELSDVVFTATRTRTDITGYQLGSQSDKPLQPKGDYALLSDIAVKSVKLNGAALTPDANGAVNVPALPLTGGEINGDLLVNGQVNISAFFTIARAFGSSLLFTGNIENVQHRALLSLVNASNSPSFSTIAFLQNLAPNYDATSTYELNNLCVYISKLYRCTTAIETAEEWTAAHWTEATVEDVLAAIRSALGDKAPLASPAFTGAPTAPTPASGDDSTKVATTAFVQAAVAGGGGVTPLSGQTFNFATTQGVMDALKTVIEALGGTVVNAPSLTISQGE